MLRHKKAPGFAILAAAFAALTLGGAAQAQPNITITPPGLLFSYAAGTATAPPSQQVVVSSDVAATLQSYTLAYTSGATGWLTVFPPSGSGALALQAGTPLTFFINQSAIQNLPIGTYIAQLTLSITPAPAAVQTIAVFLTVGPGSGGGGGTNLETITPSPTSLSFAFQPGSAVPAAQAVAVTTSDNANVTSRAVTDDGGAWLMVTPANGATPGSISVAVNPAALGSGTYTGNVIITGSNNVATVPVTLVVGSAALTANPAMLTLSEPQNYGVSAPVPLMITATGTAPLLISTTADGNWLQTDVSSASAPTTINVRANDSGLAQGTYMGTVNIQSGTNNMLQVPVTLTVGPPATLSLSPASLTFTYQINDQPPATQSTKVSSLTGAAQTFAVTTATNDGAKWLTAAASPNTTPGFAVIGIAPTGLTAGTYSGVVTVTASTAGASPQPILVTLIVKPAPVPTVISVNSAASYATGGVAPGELVTIFGSSIGPAAGTSPTPGTAPVSLGNTGVTFDGIPAPIYYVSSTQTTVQVPYNVPQGQTVMKLSYNGISSVGTTLPVTPTFPGLFTADRSGQRQIAALNADLSINSAGNPATRGQALVLYGTGEGQTAPPVVEGQRVPIVVPLPQTPYQIQVTIGGQVAPVLYAGETPGALSGLLQINVTVPTSTPVGANIPVVVTINGRQTQANITVAIQ